MAASLHVTPSTLPSHHVSTPFSHASAQGMNEAVTHSPLPAAMFPGYDDDDVGSPMSKKAHLGSIAKRGKVAESSCSFLLLAAYFGLFILRRR